MSQKLAEHKHKFSIFILLVAASAICLLLAAFHMNRSDSARYSFLLWNLMLAWIPFVFGTLAYILASSRKRILYLLILASAAAWLLFFPNAPYILTDLQHLSYGSDGIPVWYDVMMLIWFAWTGLLLGIVSLYLMQEIVERMLGRAAGWLFVLVVTGLSSFGIYIGRFMHWNSWDVWQQPFALARDIWNELRHPLANKEAYGFTFIFTLLFMFIYVALMIFGNLMYERQKQKPAGMQPTHIKPTR
jgi:uncharacterized membrane protein